MTPLQELRYYYVRRGRKITKELDKIEKQLYNLEEPDYDGYGQLAMETELRVIDQFVKDLTLIIEKEKEK